MKRRVFVAALGATAAFAWQAARPQPAPTPGRPFRIGWLITTRPERATSRVLEDAMSDLGYVEGRNVVFERRFAHDQPDRLPGLAAELVQLPVDVIIANTNFAVAAAKQATSTIPIVMVFSSNPIGRGFIQSYARPGGNITGITYNFFAPEYYGKMLGLLKEVVPGIARVGMIVQHGMSYDRAALDAAAHHFGLRLEVFEFRTLGEIEGAFAAMRRNGFDAYYSIGGPLLFNHPEQVTGFALANRLPGLHASRELVEAGALASYGQNHTENLRRVARYVDQILKGVKPGELAVEQPLRFELVINLKTARALGVTIPPSVLLRADEVLR